MKSIGIRKFRKKNSSKNNFKVSKNFSKIHNPITCSDPSKPIAFMIQPTTMTKKMTIEATLARLTVVFINDLILLSNKCSKSFDKFSTIDILVHPRGLLCSTVSLFSESALDRILFLQLS